MRHIKTLVAGLAAMALTAGAAVAQDSTSQDNMSAGSASSGAMSKDSMSSGSMKMSKSDMATMKTCQGMAHDAMMANAKCKAFMAKHPDMFNSDGTMKPQ